VLGQTNAEGSGLVTAIVSGFLAGATHGWARNLFARFAETSEKVLGHEG
jgi:hypothetical protein